MMADIITKRKEKLKREYDQKVKQLHKEGAVYLRLSAVGITIYTEWETKDGKIIKLELP